MSNVTFVVGQEELYSVQSSMLLLHMGLDPSAYPPYSAGSVHMVGGRGGVGGPPWGWGVECWGGVWAKKKIFTPLWRGLRWLGG